MDKDPEFHHVDPAVADLAMRQAVDSHEAAGLYAMSRTFVRILAFLSSGMLIPLGVTLESSLQIPHAGFSSVLKRETNVEQRPRSGRVASHAGTLTRGILALESEERSKDCYLEH